MISQPASANTGNGDSVVETKSIKKPVLVQMSHSGTSNFVVWAKDRNASNIDLLANEIGNYFGTVLLELSPREQLKYFEVGADGAWSIETKGLKKAPNWKGKTYAGSGDQVIELKRVLKANTRLTLSHSGDGNFIIWTYDRKGKRLDLKANEIGTYSGTKFLGPSVRYISIQSNGDWSISR